jgi:hypothetical protein
MIGGFAAYLTRRVGPRPPHRNDLMDRKLARKNIVAGLIVGGVAVVMFGLTFLAASLYLS